MGAAIVFNSPYCILRGCERQDLLTAIVSVLLLFLTVAILALRTLVLSASADCKRRYRGYKQNSSGFHNCEILYKVMQNPGQSKKKRSPAVGKRFGV